MFLNAWEVRHGAAMAMHESAGNNVTFAYYGPVSDPSNEWQL
jgi:hypothetical protein